jgi:leucyl aminopeptidase (aminopeptidase T)
MNGNHTDLTVAMYEMKDPSKETIFENCVADVNIPVGEVFTSPKLKGTNGVLHVTKVFLNGLEYKDLDIEFVDGMIGEYSCSNFVDAAEGKKYIKENILANHDTLPLGEFAIGTNTTAYVVGRKYDIAAKLPILIAEKTGPHFAVGDTCYSHEEELVTYNPDGKQIVARENEVSALRSTDPAKAYLNCHTDITIPYDELGELTAVRADGSEVCIIREGKFVLPGTEELNRPLENN